MKPSKLLFPLILLGLALFTNSAKRKNGSKEKNQNTNRQHTTTNDKHDPTQNGKTHIPIREVSIIQPTTYEEDCWRDEERNFRKRQIRLALWLNWITAITGAFALGGLIILYLTLKATQDAVKAANEQADAATKTFEENVRTFRLDQRAWLTVEIPQKNVVLNEKQWLTATVEMANIGKTAARQVKRQFIMEVLSADQPPTFDYSRPHMIYFQPVIMPNEKRPFDVIARTDDLKPRVFAQSEIDALKAGKTYIVVFGLTTFVDIHGISRWVRHCSWFVQAIGSYPTRPCAEYSDVDNN